MRQILKTSALVQWVFSFRGVSKHHPKPTRPHAQTQRNFRVALESGANLLKSCSVEAIRLHCVLRHFGFRFGRSRLCQSLEHRSHKKSPDEHYVSDGFYLCSTTVVQNRKTRYPLAVICLSERAQLQERDRVRRRDPAYL